MNTRTATALKAVKAAIESRDRQLRDELRDELMRSNDQRYIDLAGSVHDQADESVANELIDVENALVQRHLNELRELERARTRFDDGEINTCSDCGGEIGIKRLQANPVAIRCIDCQEKAENAVAHGAPPRL